MVSSDAVRSRRMVLSAVVTTCPSSATMNEAIDVRASTKALAFVGARLAFVMNQFLNGEIGQRRRPVPRLPSRRLVPWRRPCAAKGFAGKNFSTVRILWPPTDVFSRQAGADVPRPTPASKGAGDETNRGAL